MRVSITKGETHDRITIRRDDGTEAETHFPKKGPLPHDAIHYFVERELGLSGAFWGMIATGSDPQDVQAIAKAGGHASASRAGIPDPAIVQLLQAERLVECFEAVFWQGDADPQTFQEVAETACGYSHVPLPDMSDAAVARINAGIAALREEWIPARTGHIFAFDWPAA